MIAAMSVQVTFLIQTHFKILIPTTFLLIETILGSEQNHSNEPNSTLSNNQPNDSNGTFNFSNNVDFVNKFSSFSIAPLNGKSFLLFFNNQFVI